MSFLSTTDFDFSITMTHLFNLFEGAYVTV
ncbi:MAG: hypothetical protein ACI9Y1_001822 [Lentisphaeria bacterium]|jgi:hypothetical protein